MKFFDEIFSGVIAPVEKEMEETFNEIVFVYISDEQYLMFKKSDSDIFRPLLKDLEHFHIVDTGKFFKILGSPKVSMSVLQRLAWQYNVMII